MNVIKFIFWLKIIIMIIVIIIALCVNNCCKSTPEVVVKQPTEKEIFIFRMTELLNNIGSKLSENETTVFVNELWVLTNEYGIDPLLPIAYAKTESGLNNQVIGYLGELGMFQLRPSTAEYVCNKIGINYFFGIEKNPGFALWIWFWYMQELKLVVKDQTLLHISYNAGPGRVNNLLNCNYSKKDIQWIIYQSRGYKPYDQKITENYNMVKSSLTANI